MSFYKKPYEYHYYLPCDNYLVVLYYYHCAEKQTEWEPGYPAEIEIESINCKGVDITELLDDDVYSQIQTKISENHEENLLSDREEARIERWEAEREERWIEQQDL